MKKSKIKLVAKHDFFRIFKYIYFITEVFATECCCCCCCCCFHNNLRRICTLVENTHKLVQHPIHIQLYDKYSIYEIYVNAWNIWYHRMAYLPHAHVGGRVTCTCTAIGIIFIRLCFCSFVKQNIETSWNISHMNTSTNESRN